MRWSELRPRGWNTDLVKIQEIEFTGFEDLEYANINGGWFVFPPQVICPANYGDKRAQALVEKSRRIWKGGANDTITLKICSYNPEDPNELPIWPELDIFFYRFKAGPKESDQDHLPAFWKLDTSLDGITWTPAAPVPASFTSAAKWDNGTFCRWIPISETVGEDIRGGEIKYWIKVSYAITASLALFVMLYIFGSCLIFSRRKKKMENRAVQALEMNEMWFYKDIEGKPRGPYGEERMREWFETNLLKPSTPVRMGSMSKFHTIQSLYSTKMGQEFLEAPRKGRRRTTEKRPDVHLKIPFRKKLFGGSL